MHVSSRRLVPAALLALLVSLLLAVPAQAAGTGTISGTVTARPAGGSASAYAGATVVFDRHTPTGTVSSSVQSAANGSFTATLPNGTYDIRTYPKDYGELGQYGYEYYDDRSGPYGSTEIVVNGNATTLAHQIELRPIGKVVGTVRNEAGQPMPGVNVGFLQDNGGGYGTVTDAQGRYDSLEGEWSGNLIPGNYTVNASSGGYGFDEPQYYYDTYPVTMGPGATIVQDITMRQRPTVTFTVLDTDGKPLVDAPLLFKVRNDGGNWDWPQYGPNNTDEKGRYRFVDNFDEFKVQFGLPADYRGTGVPEYWEDAYTFEAAKVLSFPAGVAKTRNYTVRLSTGRTFVSQAASGKRLTADAGSWGAEVTNRSYQWLANDAAIPGATRTTYVVTNKVAGKRIGVRITGKLSNGDVVSTTSTVTKRAIGTLTTHRPRVSGKARLGRTLTAKTASWGPGSVKVRYSWYRGGKLIKGADGRKHRLVKADLGRRITVRVTGRKTSYATATVTSKPTAKVRR